MAIRGEYWIQDGHVEFADGDIGDLNHEAIAMNYVAGQHLDSLINLAEELDINTAKFSAYSEYPAQDMEQLLAIVIDMMEDMEDPGNPAMPKYRSRQQVEMELMRQLGIDNETLQVLRGIGDARLHVMKYEGWVAVRGNNLEFYGMDAGKLKKVSDGLSDILGQELEQEGISDENLEFSLYDHKTHRSTNLDLDEIRSGNLFKAQTLPQTKTNYIVPTTGERQYGRELWRGTSESVLGFIQWLNRKK
jgi:hypothetical protein